MNRSVLFFTFILLAVASVLLSWYRPRALERVALIPHGFSITPDWFGRRDRLERLESLGQVLQRIKSSYVDPKRVDPTTMFGKALDSVSQEVPEVRVIHPEPKKTVLVVDQARLEFETDVPTLNALHSFMSDALKFVRANKKSDVSEKELEVASVNGLLSTLDPHSIYLPEDIYKETKVGTSGTFGGLGIVIGLRDTKLTVISPLEGTPAHKAGLKAGDTITKIGDESTLNMSLTEAVEKMRGPKGTSVTIWVLRQDWTEPRAHTIVRDIIRIVSVESQLLPDDVGYLKIKNFQGNTAKDMAAHLHRMAKEAGGSLNALILDLRNNPGGLLDQAVAAADKFLAEGPIVTTVGFSDTVREEEKANGPGTEPPYPMAVLVNEGSASASEIVAGALQRRERAVVLGQRTFGKGTVQSIFDLPDNAALKLTIAQYLTPGDFSIQEIGIVPDVKLTASTITGERIDVFGGRRRHGEMSLERHFDRPGHPVPTLRPAAEIHYLEERSDKQIVEDDSIPPPGDLKGPERAKKILAEFEVRAAYELIRKEQRKKQRKELIRSAEALAARLNREETAKIANALAKKGVDWTPPSRKQADCGVPTVRAQVAAGEKTSLRAGDKTNFSVTLSNPGPCTLHQSWAGSESKNYLFDDREFLFGKLAPGASLTREVKVEIPKATPTNLAEIGLTFHEAQNIVPAGYELRAPISGADGPRFAFAYELNDRAGPATKGNGNGVIDAGERVELVVRVKNVGASPTSEASAILKEPAGKSVQFKRGRSPIPDLAPDAETKVSFLFSVSLPPAEPALSLELTLVDPVYRAFSSKKLEFPIGAAPAKPEKKPAEFLTPPKISMDAEKLAFQTAPGQFLRLNGTLTHAEAVKDLFIFVNGRKVFYQGFPEAGRSERQPFDSTVPLEPGVNRVLVVTRDAQDLRDQKAFLVQRAGGDAAGRKALAAQEESADDIDLFLMDPFAR